MKMAFSDDKNKFVIMFRREEFSLAAQLLTNITAADEKSRNNLVNNCLELLKLVEDDKPNLTLVVDNDDL